MADAKVCPDCGRPYRRSGDRNPDSACCRRTLRDGTLSEEKDGASAADCFRLALARERTAHEETRRALRETADLAEEGWGYASDYFQRKWDCAERIAKARAALWPQNPAAPLVWAEVDDSRAYADADGPQTLELNAGIDPQRVVQITVLDVTLAAAKAQLERIARDARLLPEARAAEKEEP